MVAGSDLLPRAGFPLASAFLRLLGEEPWNVVAGVRENNLTEKSLKETGKEPPFLARLIAAAEQRHEGLRVVLPEAMDGKAVWHIAISAPRQVGAKAFRIPPTIVLRADRVYMLWRLQRPLPAEEASAISIRMAQAVGGKSLIGGSVPLPGTILYTKAGFQISDKSSVILSSVTPHSYRVSHGELIAPPMATPAEPSDPNTLSVLLGETEDGSPVWFRPGEQVNGSAIVLGSSGSGKTKTLQVLGKGVHDFGTTLLLLDYHGDVDLPGVPTVLLSSGTDSTYGLNPMELDTSNARRRGIGDQYRALHEMIVQACPSLGHRQRRELLTSIEETYREAGFKEDDPASWNRPSPTFGRLFDKLASVGNDGLIAGVSQLFEHPIFQRTKYLPIEQILQGSTRLDLSELPDDVRLIVTQTLLRQSFRALRMRGPIPERPANDKERFRLFVMIDEAKNAASKGDEKKDILNVLFTEARKFGLGMILASQMVDHFSTEVRANAATWIALYTRWAEEAKRNAPNIGLADPEALMKLRGKGDGYYRDSSSPIPKRIQVRPLSAR
jgi:hypothetical protein